MQPVIYIRTSTEDQRPENQIDDCLSINSWGEAEIVKDQQSAWKEHKERSGFEEIRKRIKGGNVKHLIVWDLDRIYRDRIKLIQFFQFCKIYKCQIHSFRQQWLESLNNVQPPFNEIMHDLMLQVMGWLAEEESTKKSHRVKAAIDRRGGVTKSRYGNKWGRKSLSTQKKNRIHELKREGDLSIRQIAKEVGVSIGAVHKILHHIPTKKP